MKKEKECDNAAPHVSSSSVSQDGREGTTVEAFTSPFPSGPFFLCFFFVDFCSRDVSTERARGVAITDDVGRNRDACTSSFSCRADPVASFFVWSFPFSVLPPGGGSGEGGHCVCPSAVRSGFVTSKEEEEVEEPPHEEDRRDPSDAFNDEKAKKESEAPTSVDTSGTERGTGRETPTADACRFSSPRASVPLVPTVSS